MGDVNISRQNDLSDELDSDDDIMSFVGVNTKPSSTSGVGQNRNKPSSSEKSISALSQIFATCLKSKEKEAKLEETRRKIEGLKILQDQEEDDGTSETNVKPVNRSEHDQLLGKLALEEIKILQTHIGERVLHLERRFQLFDNTNFTQNGYGDSVKTQNEPEGVLSSNETEEVTLGNSYRIYDFSQNMFDRDPVYLFRLLSVQSDPPILIRGSKQLCSLLTKSPSLTNLITLNEILEVFVNCGADLDRLLPSEELKNIADVSFKNQLFDWIESEAKNVGDASFNWYTLENLFESILNVIVVVLGSCDPWNDDHLMVLLIVFCSLALDVNFALSTLIANLQNAIVFTVGKFDDSLWSRRLSKLSRHICNLTDDHHNLSFLIKLFYGGKRIAHLKRVTAFRAVNKVLGIELGDFDEILPEDVVRFLNGCSLKKVEIDFYLWHSILNMIDCCISDTPGDVSPIVLEELSSAMKKLTSTFKENLRCPDAIKVKDVATRLTSKWSVMKSVGRISQRTMFSYLISEKPSFIDMSTTAATEDDEGGEKEEEMCENNESETLSCSAMEIS